MSSTALKVNLVLSGWEQHSINPPHPVPTEIAYATSQRKYMGDMEGHAHVSYILSKVMDAPGDVWTFTGQQVFEGTVKGKKGSFTANETGTCDQAASGKWVILPETAQGELKGISGTGSYAGEKCGNEERIAGELDVQMP